MTTRIKSTTQIKPKSNRLVVRPTQQEQPAKRGIFLPGTAKERPQDEALMAVGPRPYLGNGERLEMELEAGDKVIYTEYAGTEIKVEDEKLPVLGANDALAKIT